MADLTETQPFDAGVALATFGPDDAKAKAQEAADAKAWLKRIEEARTFDEGARKQYAMDRRYARGDVGEFEVTVPIAQSYIDVLRSFLYAKDPDLDILPSAATEPPPQSAIKDMAREKVASDPAIQQQIAQAGEAAFQQVMQQGMARIQAALPQVAESGQTPDPATIQANMPPDPNLVRQQAIKAATDQAIKAEMDALMAPYEQRRKDAEQLAQTLELVVAQLWKKGRLKEQAELQVGSTLTVATGWLKASWQERRGEDPLIRSQINDLQDNLARVTETRRELDEGEAADVDATRASLEQQIAGLTSKVEVLLARGFAIDFVPAEDIQVSPDVIGLASYRDAPWIAHRTFMTPADAKARFPGIADKIAKADEYFQVKPVDPLTARDVGVMADVSASEADTYRKGGSGTTLQSSGASVCVWEVWNRLANNVLTVVEGLDGYARAPYAPDPGTTRFYPFFQFLIGSVDGERHPKSLITRAARLFDEYNRTRSNYAEHRRRCLPKTAFDETNYAPDEIKKLEAGGTGEMVGLKPTRPGEPVSGALAPVAYPQVDMALYDTSVIRAELEIIFGIQEALSSSIHTAKTATESEIQQQGTNARLGYMKDSLDVMMGDLAEYTAEVALQKLTAEDVKQIAGPWAFWPEGMTVDDLGALVTVNIRAGSSGKPDTTRQQQAWATVMPVLQAAIVQVGGLRGSTPSDIADCVEELIAETLRRTGDRLDPERFLPQAPDSDEAPPPGAEQGMPANPMQMAPPPAPPQPQATPSLPGEVNV